MAGSLEWAESALYLALARCQMNPARVVLVRDMEFELDRMAIDLWRDVTSRIRTDHELLPARREMGATPRVFVNHKRGVDVALASGVLEVRPPAGNNIVKILKR